MKSTMMQVPLSTNQILERAGRYFGTSDVMGRRPDKSIYQRSYAEVYRRARQLAQALREKAGIAPGEAVATISWNHAWHLECYFGIPAAAAVLHTINLLLTPEEIAYIMVDAGDRLLIIDDVLLPVWEKVRPLLRQPPRVVVVPFGGAALPGGYESFEDFIADDAIAYQYPVQDENEAVGMCYTSGTTGRPKGVVYSHRSMMLHAITGCIPDIFGIAGRDKILVVTPMFHANAWALPFSALMVGADLILPGPHMGGDDLLELIERSQATIAVGVPTIWAMLLQSMEATVSTRPLALAKGFRMLVGGAPMPAVMIERFAKFGINVVHGWGMTETSPIGSFTIIKTKHDALPPEQQYALRAMQGVAAPFVDMRITNARSEEQPWDGVSTGEVQVRGPWISGSYHNAPDHDPEKFTADGWLRTGDIATINAEGYMRIVDRSKDLIKSGGEWISSIELENLALKHPAVAEAAVVAIAHPKWDERPLVIVVTRPGMELDGSTLRAFMAPHLARFQVPDDFEFVESIPRTATGKFLKNTLRDLYRHRQSITPG